MQKIFQIWSLLNYSFRVKFLLIIFFGFLASFLEIFSLSLLFTILASMVGNTINFENIEIFERVINFFNQNNINLFLIFLFAYFIKFLFTLFNIYFLHKTVFNFLNFLTTKLFEKYLYTELNKIKKINSSEILRNLTEEIGHVSTGLLNSICVFFVELIMIFGLIFLIFVTQSLTSIGVLFIVISISYVIASLIKKKVFKLAKTRQNFSYFKMNHIKQSFIGIKDVKIFSAENVVLFNLKRILKKLANAQIFIIFGQTVPRHLIEFILVFGIIVIIFILQYSGLSPESIFSSLAFLSIILVKSLPVLNKLINSFVSFSSYAPSLNVVSNELIEYKNLKINQNIPKLTFKKSIQLKNISLSYDGKKIFNNVSLNISKGKILGIIGRSGSGKSSLVEIIMGLIKPDNGEIFIDEVNLSGNEKSWIRNIGYVPQNVYLNSDKVKNNIAFGIEENKIDFNKIRVSAKNSNIDDFIENLPNKYDQDLGENAQLVSGGQKQRLGIARALYKDCDLLIFDEATNSLDSKTEKKFLNFIKSLKGDKTVIIISHNENIREYCDEIFDFK